MSGKLDQVDICEILEMLKFFRISTRGLNNVDEMRAKLREYLEGSCKRKVGETHQAISDAGYLDTKKRKKLQNLYIQTAEFLDHLDTEFIETLQKNLGDLRKTLEERMKQVEPRDQYVVLVAGETSAGKSSVINLILGEDLLPHATLSTTSTICELKYGVKPKICVHFKDNGTQKRYSMMHELTESTEETYQQQINNFVNLKKDRDKAPYKKIELFFPHPLLEERVMIVDSPGVGESEVMSEFVLSYLPRAFCFMYVINSDNAGGIQEDRLGILLKCAKSNLTAASKSHLAGCALFVCNKWDRIKPEEQDEVKKEQIQKLSNRIDNLDPKSQIVYLSCMTAQQAQSCGYITEDFHDLITGISNLLVSSMENNLLMHYRWLEDFVSRVSYQVKTVLKSTKMSRLETEKTVKRVMNRMEDLKISQRRKFDELSKHQSQILEEIIEKLVDYFKSDDTIKQFCKWSPSEAPEAKAKWQETKSEVLKCISERTQQFVQSWEDDNHEFARAQVSLANFCSEKYDVMEEEIRQVEEVFLNDVELETPQHGNKKITMLQAKSPRIIAENAPVWLRQGLSSVVIGSPLSSFRSKVKKKLQYRTKLEKYIDDPCDYMSKRSHKCLQTIATTDRLLPFINEQLADAVQFLMKIKKKISKVMESDEMLYQQLLENDRSTTQIQKVYEPVDRKLKSLTCELTVYNLIEIRESDFKSDELKWDGNFQSIIGNGRFSTVYKGTLSRSGEPKIEVALKVFRDPLTANNVWHFADEEHALRKLKHPHIVTFYGASLIKKLGSIQVMLVMEKCKENLKSHIFEHHESIPGRSRDSAVAKEVCQWLKEITDALTYIHEQGIIHRDLKLENILLTEENSVKVSDVGVAKPTKDITGTLAGTPLYIAPEVFHSEVYGCKADIFSLGIMLWEMWYGEQAFSNVHAPKLEALFRLVDEGCRPEDVKGCKQPPLRWKQLMNQCWDRDPKKRPTAGKCYEEVTTLSSEIMQCMNSIAKYDCTATPTDQPSIKTNQNLKLLDDSKSTWQLGNSKCETDHIPSTKANEEFLNRPEKKDIPEIGTAIQSGEYLDPQGFLTRIETVIATYAYLPKDENELSLRKGDRVTVLEKGDEGWWKGRVGKKIGWFPANYIQMEEESTKQVSSSRPVSPLADNPENHGTVKQSSEHLVPRNPLNNAETVTAKNAFLPEHEDDLTFKKGDSVTVLEKREDGWWKGRVEQKEGWFPSSYILVEKESTKPASNIEPASALVNQSSSKVIAQEHQKPPFSSKKWFWGSITRVDAEKLMNETAAVGDFLVRESKSKKGAYAVSLKAVGKIKHFVVTLQDGKVKGGANINFNSLEEFIEHFKTFPILTTEAGNKMFLVKPFEKSA